MGFFNSVLLLTITLFLWAREHDRKRLISSYFVLMVFIWPFYVRVVDRLAFLFSDCKELSYFIND